MKTNKYLSHSEHILFPFEVYDMFSLEPMLIEKNIFYNGSGYYFLHKQIISSDGSNDDTNEYLAHIFSIVEIKVYKVTTYCCLWSSRACKEKLAILGRKQRYVVLKIKSTLVRSNC
jgi:hypothetical protein